MKTKPKVPAKKKAAPKVTKAKPKPRARKPSKAITAAAPAPVFVTVSDLLARSTQAHVFGRALRNGIRVPAHPARAMEALTRARALRLLALAQDPERTDPAGAAERVPHDQMMAFYRDQLGAE